MGHYLSEMESSEDHENRVIYRPMREKLRVYDEEVKRGLVHTEEYSAQMEDYRRQLKEKGWSV